MDRIKAQTTGRKDRKQNFFIGIWLACFAIFSLDFIKNFIDSWILGGLCIGLIVVALCLIYSIEKDDYILVIIDKLLNKNDK